jgi:hypothetical protein
MTVNNVNRFEWIDDPAVFHREHAPLLTRIGAAAFAQRAEVMEPQVASRFAHATLALIIRADERTVGFCLFARIPGDEDLWSIEGWATLPEYQNLGLGAEAFTLFLDATGAGTVVSVSRNPAVATLMARRFTIVLPDLTTTTDDPLWTFKHPRTRDAVQWYARHLGADESCLPFLVDRYPGGLYGGKDPGKFMPLPELADHPANAMIVVGTGKRGICQTSGAGP